MTVLEGRYVFEKIYCPACGVLLNADMVEEKHGALAFGEFQEC